MNLLFDGFWFFLPAGLANLSPVFAKRLPWFKNWNTPISSRLLGTNKTWRGLVFGTLTGGVVCVLQQMILPNTSSLPQAFVIGAAMGAGALVGDAVESFFKRRRGIKPGNAWFPFDQTDYIIGGLLFVAPFAPLSSELIMTIFALYISLHLITSYLGFLAGFKDKPI